MSDFPQGNARIGDYAYVFINKAKLQQKVVHHARVFAVGVGIGGRHIQIQIGAGSGNRYIVSCFDHAGGKWPEPRVIIEPPLGELLEFDQPLAQMFYRINHADQNNWACSLRHDIRVVRKATHSDQLQYGLMCVRCWTEINIREVMDEGAELRVRPRQVWSQGKPYINTREFHLRCACREFEDGQLGLNFEKIERYQ